MKQAGFSLDEIREMTMTDFIVFTDLIAGPGDDKKANKSKVKEATQADIDRLFPV